MADKPGRDLQTGATFDAALREAVRYDPLTGHTYWAVKVGNRHVGDLAGAVDREGYVVVTFKGRRLYVHRIAWFLMTGEWPTALIDHKNQDHADNRWDNLREANRSQNMANSRGRNTGLPKGVHLRESGRFAAYITCKQTRYCLGRFDTPEAAHEAYMKRARELFGEYARSA